MAGELHLTELMTVLRRRLRVVIAIAAAGTAMASLGAVLTSPHYTANAQLLYEPHSHNPENTKAASGPAADEAIFQTHIVALTSRTFLSAVFDALHERPAGQPAPAGSNEASPDFKSMARVTVAPLAGEVSPSTPGLARADEVDLNQFARQLHVYQEGTSRVIAITFTAKNPEEAALTANKIAQFYVASDQERKLAEIDRLVGWLDARLPQAKANLAKAELSREATAAGQIYANLLQNREQLRAQQEMMRSDLQVLSPASPPAQKSSSSPFIFIPPVLIICLLGGSLFAVLWDRLDDRLHSVQEVVNELDVPCIGLVPQTDHATYPAHQLVLKDRFAAYTEAIRSLAAMLQLAPASRAAKVTLFSSSVTGEGTTTLALSFAVYAALLGRRTLLVDFGSARSRGANAPGCAAEIAHLDVQPLASNMAPGAIHHLAGLDVDYFPVDGQLREPLLVFSSGQLEDLVNRLRDAYDCIVIDAPPLLFAPESRLLVPFADTAVIAVKWDMTRRGVVCDALNIVRQVMPAGEDSANRIVTVLTQVDFKKHVARRYAGWECVRELRETREKKPLPRARRWDFGLAQLPRPSRVERVLSRLERLRSWIERKKAWRIGEHSARPR